MGEHRYVVISERELRHTERSLPELLRLRGINPDAPYTERRRPGSSFYEYTQPPLASDLTSPGELADA